MSSYFEKFQTLILDTLKANTSLSGATFIAERASSFSGKMEEKLDMKSGLVILVRFPFPSVGNVISLPVRFDTLLFKVRVIDNLLTNTTGITANEAADIIYKALFGLDLTSSVAYVLDVIQPRAAYPWSTQAGTSTTNIVEMTFQTTLAMTS
jgi:hypothetical protein